MPCETHTEQIKTLFKRVEGVESMKDFMYSLDKNMALQTQLEFLTNGEPVVKEPPD